MAGFAELMAQRGMISVSTATDGPRERAIAQANSMLNKLGKLTSPTQLDSKTSNQNWWGISSRNGKRRVTVRYDNKVVLGLVTEVDDDLKSVREAIESFKIVIKDADDDAWKAEEERRRTDTKGRLNKRK